MPELSQLRSKHIDCLRSLTNDKQRAIDELQYCLLFSIYPTKRIIRIR